MTHAEVAKHPWMMGPSGANREFVFTIEGQTLTLEGTNPLTGAPTVTRYVRVE